MQRLLHQVSRNTRVSQLDRLHHMFQKPSESELEAIRLVSKGMSSKQVAEKLEKSVRTIENQLRHARKRLNARNLAELINKCEPWI